jgi:quercetin dioxygenase-like cupin family protein
METPKDQMASATVFSYAGEVNYQSQGIVSKQIIKKPTGNVTLFAFDAGQNLSEHSAPFDALVQVIDGQGEILINGQPFQLNTGECIIMPANIPHAVNAKQAFKMLLTMIRS